MLSLVDTTIDEAELIHCFIEKSMKLRTQDADEPPKFPMNILSVDDGIVYHFDGVYSFATKNNMVRQIIVTSPKRFGVVMIDTREVSKHHKALIKKIENFVSSLTPLLAQMTIKEQLKIITKDGYTLSDVREQIIKDNSL